MVFMHRLIAVASCSTCLASAFIGSAPASSTARDRVPGVAVESANRVRARRPNPPHSQQQFNRPSSLFSRRREAVPPLQLSSRTVDVDVIDVTDVTEEEARREKEQVIPSFMCVQASLVEHWKWCVR